MASPNYYQALSDMPAPTRGGEAQTIAASEADAKAITIQHAKDNEQVNFLAGTGLAAVKGYKEAQLQKEIDGVLNNTVAPGYVGKDVAVKNSVFNNAINNLPTMSGMDGGNEALAEFQGKVALLNDARSQGVMSRDQAVARIAAAVKSYSADLPGLATDFRKIAAEQTGISNIDVYGVHTALISKKADDEHAKAMFNAQLEQDKKIAEYEGKKVADINDSDRQRFYVRQQRTAAANSIETDIKLGKLSSTESDERNTNLASLRTASAVDNISKEYAKLLELSSGSTVLSANEAAQQRLKLDGILAKAQTSLEREFNSWSTPSKDRPIGWSLESRTKYVASMKEEFSKWRAWAASTNGQSMLDAIVKNEKTGGEGIVAHMRLLNPFMAVSVANGTMPAYAQMAITANLNEDKLTAQLGGEQFRPRAKQIIDVVGADPKGYAETIRGVLAGGKLNGGDSPETGKDTTNPAMAKVIRADLEATVIGIVKKPTLNDEDKVALTKYLSAWGKNFDPTDKEQLRKYSEFMTDPKRAAAFKQLEPAQALEAVRPFMLNTQQRTAVLSGEIKRLQDTYTIQAEDSVKNANILLRQSGKPLLEAPTIHVEQDVFRQGALSVSVDWGSAANKKQADLNGVGLPGAVKELKGKIDELNAYAAGYAANAPIVHPDGKYGYDSAYKDALAIVKGTKTGFYLLKQGALDTPATPTSTPQRRASDRVSTKATESEKDRVRVHAEVAAEIEQQLSVYRRLDPTKLSELDKAQIARLERDLIDIKAAK